MGLLENIGKMRLGFQGIKPKQMESAALDSKKHFTTSINGTPGPQKPGQIPSRLDLDGIQPKQYLDNPPE
jgi:hypothetical protein